MKARLRGAAKATAAVLTQDMLVVQARLSMAEDAVRRAQAELTRAGEERHGLLMVKADLEARMAAIRADPGLVDRENAVRAMKANGDQGPGARARARGRA